MKDRISEDQMKTWCGIKWQEADQLAIYKHGGTVELGTDKSKSRNL